MFTSADFPGVIPEGIVVQNRILSDNPGDVQKFLRGWLRAVKWQSDPANRAEYFAILKRTMFKGASRRENTSHSWRYHEKKRTGDQRICKGTVDLLEAERETY